MINISALNFPTNNVYILFGETQQDARTLSANQVYAAEVDDIPRIRVTPKVTNNSFSKQKLYSFEPVIVNSTAPATFNFAAIVDESAGLVGSGDFILSIYQDPQDSATVEPNAPVRLILGDVVIKTA